ncbi:hypothetical protein B0I35DRAFT_425796 [Stachybotrys elegans]|uniref:Uncharacterized protein n=1 Tax=Stachybotrys elegans TaxID=80388 RepID=A0A8K0T0C5_9HYPO|nr:hypothetical protein B0I35DRAFT_425796 [Stachybotrys elegans]
MVLCTQQGHQHAVSYESSRQHDQALPVRPKLDGCYFEGSFSWIVYNGQKTIFLPSQYQSGFGSASGAVSPTSLTAVVGSQSGRVLVFGFPDNGH